MFGLFKGKATAVAQRFSGNTDYLEGICAAAALIAAADGDIEDEEIAATQKAVASNKNLSAAFDTRLIEQTMDTMLNRAAGGRVGKQGLWKEISEIAKNPDMAEAVLLTALDVADSDGQVEPQEKIVLDRLAKELGLNLANYQ